MKRLLFAFTIISSLAITAFAQSDVDTFAPDCIKEADKLFKLGDQIRLTSTNGQFVDGYFISISYDSSIISINTKDKYVSSGDQIDFGDLSQIGYYSSGKINPLYILGGLTGGILVGAFIGAIAGSHSHEMFGQVDAAVTGAGIGAIVGMGIGFALSADANKLIEIKCEF